MLNSLSELFPKSNYAFNAVSLFTEDELSDIGQKVQYEYNQDLTTCERKFEELNRIMDLAMIISETKSYPWQNSSNVIYPLIASAAINFGASCYPEIIQDDEVVKAKIIGKDNGKIFKDAVKGEKEIIVDPQTGQPTGEFKRIGAGDKLKRGNRVATMMNWQLLEQMYWWESDIDKEVHALPILGTLYKKIYYDTLRKMPVSELIFPHKIIINNGARDIDSATITQIIELYPQEILQNIRSGYFKEFDFNLKQLESLAPNSDANGITNMPAARKKEDVNSNTNLHIFLEQHTWLDLDDDGFLEPYIITLHYDTCKVVRIIPRFKEKDIIKNDKGEIQEIKVCKYFVVRKFLPSFDGGFLGVGLGHLLSNTNYAINTTLNQLIDAGHLSITGGGLIGKNVKIRGGKITLSPNEYKMVDVIGNDIASNVYTFPKPEPSQVLFALLGSLIETGKELGSMRDVLNGTGMANMPATTYMGMVDQGTKQFKSIFKRYFKSLKEEFKLLYDLNAEYLTKEEYANILDEEKDEVSVKEDFDQKSYNIVPVADPNTIVSMQKFAQANFLNGFIGNPNVDQPKLLTQIFNTARITNTDKLIVPSNQVDPIVQIEQIKSQQKDKEIQLESQKMMIDAKKSELVDLPKVAAEIEVLKTQAMVNVATVGKITKETDLKAQIEAIKITDNLVDAEVRREEMALREKESATKHAIELAKLDQEAAKHLSQLKHEKQMSEKQLIKQFHDLSNKYKDNL